MNYYGAKELAAGFRTVRNNTITIAEEINEKDYGFSAAPEVRTVGRMLVHISLITGLQEQVHKIERRTTLGGFDFPSFFMKMMAEEQKTRSKEEIIAMLRNGGDQFAQWLEGVSDDFLGEQVGMPPGMTPTFKTRFEMLLSVKEHEMHHRGQLMIIERMLGIVPHLTRQMLARFASASGAAAATTRS